MRASFLTVPSWSRCHPSASQPARFPLVGPSLENLAAYSTPAPAAGDRLQVGIGQCDEGCLAASTALVVFTFACRSRVFRACRRLLLFACLCHACLLVLLLNSSGCTPPLDASRLWAWACSTPMPPGLCLSSPPVAGEGFPLQRLWRLDPSILPGWAGACYDARHSAAMRQFIVRRISLRNPWVTPVLPCQAWAPQPVPSETRGCAPSCSVRYDMLQRDR